MKVGDEEKIEVGDEKMEVGGRKRKNGGWKNGGYRLEMRKKRGWRWEKKEVEDEKEWRLEVGYKSLQLEEVSK